MNNTRPQLSSKQKAPFSDGRWSYCVLRSRRSVSVPPEDWDFRIRFLRCPVFSFSFSFFSEVLGSHVVVLYSIDLSIPMMMFPRTFETVQRAIDGWMDE